MKDPLICQSIREKRCLLFQYKWQNRVVEPHAHGEDHDGDTSLRAWQTSGLRRGWRMFHTAKMQGLRLSDKTFSQARPGYTPNDSAMPVIYCQL